MNEKNIICVVVDQMHAQMISDEKLRANFPNLCRLMADGVTFSNSICTTPQCTPARGSLISGLYPHKTGVVTNTGQGIKGEGIDLPSRFKTAGDYLQTAGYEAVYFGKWHLGHESWSKGFDRYWSPEDERTTEDMTKEKYRELLDDPNFEILDVKGIQTGYYMDELTYRIAKDYLAERKNSSDKPFGMFIHLVNPHDCYFVPGINETGDKVFADKEQIYELEKSMELPVSFNEENHHSLKYPFMAEKDGDRKVFHKSGDDMWKRYRAVYVYLTKLIDDYMGKLYEDLEANNLLANTVVVFTSDHGDFDTAHRMVHKGPFMYDELLKVPLVISDPDSDRKGVVSDALVSGVDILPTILDYAGAQPESALDGCSFKPVAEGVKDDNYEFIVSEYYGQQQWINPIRTVLTKDLKYNRYLSGYEELYDLSKDPHEMQNEIENQSYSADKLRLGGLLNKWMEENNDPFESFPVTNIDGEILN